MVSVLSRRFVHRLCTWQKNYLCTGQKNRPHSLHADRITPCWLSREHIPIMTPDLSSGPNVDLYFDLSVFMGSILWLYQTQGSFIISMPDTDMTENRCGNYSWTACQKNIILIFYSFNLIKVRYFYTLLLKISTCTSFRRSSVIYYYYYYYLLLGSFFHISLSWWSFTGVWVISSLHKSPGLFSVFWPFSIILLFKSSSLVCQLSSPPDPLIVL